MTDINKVVLVGRLTRNLTDNERDFGYLPNGTARANVSIAVNRSRKQQDGTWADEASFFDVVIFGKTAENLKPYLLKGKQIAVEGHLKQERWKDQQGNNRSRVSVVADNVQLLGGKTDGGQGGYDPNKSYPTAQAASEADSGYYKSQPPIQQQAGFDGSFEEDIPF